MKHLYILNLFAALLLSLEFGFSAPKTAPNPEAEYKVITEKWELKEDGTQIYNFHKELIIYTHTAMNSEYGESFIVYNPEFQELKINESYTIQTDSSIVKTPDNAFVEVLPAAAAGMPAYNHLKEMVVVHTGLELGATIVLDYSIISKPGYLPEIDIFRTLQQSSPVKKYELSFTYPDSKCHHCTNTTRSKISMRVNKDGIETISYPFFNIPALPRVPETKIQNQDLLSFTFHTYPTHSQAVRDIYAKFDSAEALKEFTEEVCADAENPMERFEAVYDFVLNHIVSCPLTFADAGFRFRSAAEVIRSAYGTEIEKVNVLNAMLNAAGIQAEPAAAYDFDFRSVEDRDDIAISAISKWFVLAKIGDGHHFQLDASSRVPAAREASFTVLLKNGKMKKVESITRKIEMDAEIDLTDGKALTEVEALFGNEFLNNAPVNAADLIDLKELKDSGHDGDGVRFEGIAEAAVKELGDLVIVTLPQAKHDLNSFHYARFNSIRSNNLKLPYLFEEEYTYTVNIPEGWVYNAAEVEKVISNRVGDLKISIHEKEGKVIVSRSISTDRRMITSEDYSDFRMLMVEWNEPHYRQVLLKRK